MIDKIYEFGKTLQKSENNYPEKSIGGYICLNKNGDFLGIEQIKEKGYKIRIPALPNTGSSSSNILFEKLTLVCGFNQNTRDNDYVKKLQQVMEYETEIFNTKYVKSIYLFIKNIREDKQLLNDIEENIKANKIKDVLFSFKVQDQKAENNKNIILSVEAICKKYTNKKEEKMIISSITGNSTIAFNTTYKIPSPGNFQNPPLFPFSKSESTSSYFLTGNEIANIGKEEGEIVFQAFQELFRDGKHYSPLFKLLHWCTLKGNQNDELLKNAEDKLIFFTFDEITTESNQKDEETTEDDKTLENQKITMSDNEVAQILNPNEAISRQFDIYNDVVYHSMYFKQTTNSRYSIYGYNEMNMKNLIDHINKFKQNSLTVFLNNNYYIKNLYSYLYTFVPVDADGKSKETNKAEWISDFFGTNINKLISSIYNNTQIPIKFVSYALSCIKNIIMCFDTDDKGKCFYQRNIKNQYIASVNTLNIYKNRKKEEDNSMDTSAYKLGQLFALYEYIQKRATGGTSVNNMFGIAMKYPKRAFPRLERIVQISLNSNNENIKNYKSYYNKKIDEICSEIINLPDSFNVDQQVDFCLGYHNERFGKNKENSKDEKEN